MKKITVIICDECDAGPHVVLTTDPKFYNHLNFKFGSFIKGFVGYRYGSNISKTTIIETDEIIETDD